MKKILSLLMVVLISILFIGCGSTTKEIKNSELDQAINNGTLKDIFDYSTYEVTDDNGNKSINVTLAYNDEVLRNGVVTGIRNIVERELSKEYQTINLTIIQEKPQFDSVNYIFKDGKWDKEVE